MLDLAKLRMPSAASTMALCSEGAAAGIADASCQFALVSTTDLDFTNSPCSFFVFFLPKKVSGGNTDYCTVFGRGRYVSESSNQGWEFKKAPTSHGSNGTPRLRFTLFNNNGSGGYELKDTGYTLTAGKPEKYFVTYNGTTFTLYHGSSPFGTKDGSIASNTLGAGLELGGITANDEFYVVLAAAWNRKLDLAEICAIDRNPWVLVTPQSLRRGRMSLAGGTVADAPQPQMFVVM